jgi:hypothetical protein
VALPDAGCLGKHSLEQRVLSLDGAEGTLSLNGTV